ncbi:MAG: PLP-dependent aminotransferase family protein [Oscillospiraceae bacterium]|jgi:2-aminoadipate transaminase|nr:PLP-dependent aminotransferase family protein [Oscillospiraceae bacterium]
MTYNFSRRISSLAPSAIREILKAASQPGVISFAAGNPAPEAFPVEAVREISARLFADRPVDCLQYGITEGYAPLRARVRTALGEQLHCGEGFDELIITSGAQQVMDLAAKALCNEGDTVLAESPSFIGSLNTFRSYGLRLRGVPLQEGGMDLDALEALLQSERNVRFIYTIPNYQNPSGVTMPEEKRRRLYALALQYGVLILEDNPYGELRYEGEALPCIKSMDTEGIVIYAGSFSKILAPGIRVGYCLAPREIIAKMTVCKQVSDVHTPIFSQLLVDEWMKSYDVAAHIKKIRALYRAKLALMCGGLEESGAAAVLRFRRPAGGLFLWCVLPKEVDMLKFAGRTAECGVAVVPGSAFAVEASDPINAVRLNFSTPADSQLRRGVEILGEVVKAGI